MNERPIPPVALGDENSVEMLRVWIAKHQLHCSIKVGMYRDINIDESIAWGTILADAARHIAMALSSGFGLNEQATLKDIREKFNAELADPTSDATGKFISPE